MIRREDLPPALRRRVDAVPRARKPGEPRGPAQAPAPAPGAPGLSPAVSRVVLASGMSPSLAPRPRRGRATVCEVGHRHPSRVEAKVCGDLRAELPETGFALYLQPRLPLFALPPDGLAGDRPAYFTPDFALCCPYTHRIVRLVDAKSGRLRSPEWRRGRLAAEATYGIPVEEVS